MTAEVATLDMLGFGLPQGAEQAEQGQAFVDGAQMDPEYTQSDDDAQASEVEATSAVPASAATETAEETTLERPEAPKLGSAPKDSPRERYQPQARQASARTPKNADVENGYGAWNTFIDIIDGDVKLPRWALALSGLGVIGVTAVCTPGVVYDRGNGGHAAIKGPERTTELGIQTSMLGKEMAAHSEDYLVIDSRVPVRSSMSTHDHNLLNFVPGDSYMQIPGVAIGQGEADGWIAFTRDGSKLTPSQKLIGEMTGNIAWVNLAELKAAELQAIKENPNDLVPAFKFMPVPGNPTQHSITLGENGGFVYDNGTPEAIPVKISKTDFIAQHSTLQKEFNGSR